MDNGNLFQQYFAVALYEENDNDNDYWIELLWADHERDCVLKIGSMFPKAEILAIKVAAQ